MLGLSTAHLYTTIRAMVIGKDLMMIGKARLELAIT